jgi:hypothetical protein
VGLEPTIPVFEQKKIFHALDHLATVIGSSGHRYSYFHNRICNVYMAIIQSSKIKHTASATADVNGYITMNRSSAIRHRYLPHMTYASFFLRRDQLFGNQQSNTRTVTGFTYLGVTQVRLEIRFNKWHSMLYKCRLILNCCLGFRGL